VKTIKEIVGAFIRDLKVVIQEENRRAIMASLAGGGARSSKTVVSSPELKKKRRKGPIQLCPVPKCGERAAPIYGMVCAKHKSLPKATIKAYRDARRAKNKK
jgi:hypothetical protein